MSLVDRLSKLMETDENFREIAQKKLSDGIELVSLLDDNEIQDYLLKNKEAGRAFFCDAENYEEFQELSEYGHTLLDNYFKGDICEFSVLSDVFDEIYIEYLNRDITDEERANVLKLYTNMASVSPARYEILVMGGYETFLDCIQEIYNQKSELEQSESSAENSKRIEMLESKLGDLGRNPNYYEQDEDDVQFYYMHLLSKFCMIADYSTDRSIALKLSALEANLEPILEYFYGENQIYPDFRDQFFKALNKLRYIKEERNSELLFEKTKDMYEKMRDIGSHVNTDKIRSSCLEEIEKAVTVLENVVCLNCDHNKTPMLQIQNIFSSLEAVGIDINEIESYKRFQKLLSEVLQTNAIGLGYYKIDWSQDGEKNDYYSLSGNYLQYLIDKKTNIFSDEGMVLRNYLKLAKIKPEFDELGVVDRVLSEYIPEGASIESEEQFLDEYIANNPKPTDKEAFDEFIEHLQIRKLLDNGFVLPSRYVNYIMKQILTMDNVVDENWEEYIQLTEAMLEDLAQNKISNGVRENSNFACYILEYIEDDGNSNGICSGEDGIVVRRNQVIELIKDKRILNLQVLFHEMVHSEQNNDMRSGNIYSYNRYVMQKEEIIERAIPEFYGENYAYLFNEIEANEQSALMLINYIDELGIEEELEIQSKSVDFYETYGRTIIKQCLETAEIYNQLYSKGENVLVDDEKRNVHDVFDDVLPQKPALLRFFPSLTIEYNSDGSKKSLKELLEGIKDRIHNEPEHTEEIRQLFADILVNGNYLTIDSFVQDASLIVENNEELGDACPIILAKKMGSLALEFGNNSESMQAEQRNISIDLVKKIIQILNDYSSRKNNLHETIDAVYSFKKLEDMLAGKVTKEAKEEVAMYDEPSIRFLLMASVGVTTEELSKLEKSMVEMEEERVTVSTISSPEDRVQDDEIKDQ